MSKTVAVVGATGVHARRLLPPSPQQAIEFARSCADPKLPASHASFRLKNKRAREALGWAPFYANCRIGLVR